MGNKQYRRSLGDPIPAIDVELNVDLLPQARYL
jgi:hypothetical protein